MATLTFDTYGKTHIRLLQVTRDGSRHEVTELNTQILFEGDLAESYVAGDNSKVLPTDTMKNTVYALARKTPIVCVEDFARDLGRHFLGRLPHLRQVTVEIAVTPWNRVGDYGAAFTQAGNERRIAASTVARSQETATSGIRNLQILKTADSGFAGYPKDEYTTLPETTDRILATSFRATWHFASAPASYRKAGDTILAAMLKVFAENFSLSAQTTLFQMGEAALQVSSEISRLDLLVKKLQTELQIERQYNQALEVHVRTLTGLDES